MVVFRPLTQLLADAALVLQIVVALLAPDTKGPLTQVSTGTFLEALVAAGFAGLDVDATDDDLLKKKKKKVRKNLYGLHIRILHHMIGLSGTYLLVRRQLLLPCTSLL